MLRQHLAFLALVPAVALGWASCAADPEPGEAADDGAAAIVVPGIVPLGTFVGDPKVVGSMPLVAFLGDGTYHRTRITPCVGPGVCASTPEDGHYSVWLARVGPYVAFTPEGGGDSDVYRYELKDNLLSLVPKPGGQGEVLTRTVTGAWCADTLDCAQQGLPPGLCGGEWQCEALANVCTYTCPPPTVSLFGTYRRDPVVGGGMALIALLSDGTYHRALERACDVKVCDLQEEDGTFVDYGDHLTFLPDNGSPAEKWAYEVTATALKLFEVNTAELYVFGRSVTMPWCAAPKDCALQGLPEPPCKGEWTCPSVCAFVCAGEAEES